MVLQFYHYPPSPPSRAVYMTIKALGVEHELHITNLFKQEHKTPEYAKINPRQKVPAIVDGDLHMGESGAIASYICNKYQSNSDVELYPTDPVKRAKVDQLLYIGETVSGAILEYPAPPKIIMQGIAPDESKRPILENVLSLLEGFLSETTFIAGDKITIADFLTYVWITVPTALPSGFDYSAFPKVSAWIDEIQKLPYHDECNVAGVAVFKQIFKDRLKPKIEFYHNPISPFSRSVHMTLEALGLPYDLKHVDLRAGEQKKPEFLKMNPRGKVPVIKIGNFCLSESRAIATFLVSQYAEGEQEHLYPKDPKQRSKVDKLLYLSEDIFNGLVKWLPREYLFGDGMPNDDHSALDKVISEVESGIEGKYLTGDNLTIADLFIYIYCDFANYANYDWSLYPKLSAVFQNVKALSYHDTVNAAVFTQLMAMVKDKLPKLKTKAPTTGF